MAYQLLTPSDGDRAKLVAVQFSETSTSNLQACLTFRIQDEASPNNGRITTYFGSFHENAIDFTVDAIRACGWTGDNVADVPAAFDRGELDSEVSLKIVNEQVTDRNKAPLYDEAGNERWRDRVAFVNIPGEGGGAGFKPEKPVEGQDLANFGARLRTAVANAGRRKPATKTPPRTPPRNTQAPRSSGGSHALDDSIPPPSDDDRGW